MSPPSASAAGGFDGLLREFRNEGCTLLVVGETPPEARRAATQRLLGDAHAHRTRLLVATTDRPDRRLPSDLSPDESDIHVVEAAAGVRGPGDVGDPRPLSTVESDLTSTLDQLAPDEGFPPGVLRVGVDDLLPLVSAYGEDGAKKFLRGLREVTTDARGIGHAVLPVSYEDPLVSSLEPVVDAVVEQRRADDGAHEERWHVPEAGLTTDWFRLDGTV